MRLGGKGKVGRVEGILMAKCVVADMHIESKVVQ